MTYGPTMNPHWRSRRYNEEIFKYSNFEVYIQRWGRSVLLRVEIIRVLLFYRTAIPVRGW